MYESKISLGSRMQARDAQPCNEIVLEYDSFGTNYVILSSGHHIDLSENAFKTVEVVKF